MTRKHCRRREIMPQPPRGLRPGLARDQQVELSIVHLSLLDTIMHGEADVGVLWQLVGCILTWSRVSEIMKLGREEMLPQLDLVTREEFEAVREMAILARDENERLAARLNHAGQATYERVWRLPLWDEYGPAMKSDIADLRNVTNTGEAGTITAAKFLEEFTEGLNWAHLDIAGTAWADKEKPYIPKGAVGIGIRLLVELMEHWK